MCSDTNNSGEKGQVSIDVMLVFKKTVKIGND